MANLPADVVVEPRVVNGEPEVFLSIEGSTFHLRPDDAYAIGDALVLKAHEAEADHHQAERARDSAPATITPYAIPRDSGKEGGR